MFVAGPDTNIVANQWRDNVFVERLWRTIKYERVYLRAYDGVSAAKTDIAQFIQHRAASRQPGR
jgi:putative transposase